MIARVCSYSINEGAEVRADMVSIRLQNSKLYINGKLMGTGDVCVFNTAGARTGRWPVDKANDSALRDAT